MIDPAVNDLERIQTLLDLDPRAPGVDQTQRCEGIKLLVGDAPGSTRRFLKYVQRQIQDAIHAEQMRQFDEDQA